MAEPTVSLSKALRMLNDWADHDPVAVKAIIEARVLCNNATLNHPTIQAGVDNGIPRVGFMGILNGLFGIRSDGFGHIVAVIDDKVSPSVRFITTEEWRSSYGTTQHESPRDG